MSQRQPSCLQRPAAWRPLQLAWAVLPALGGLLSCTEFEPGTDELSLEVASVQAPPGEDWGCLSTVGPAAPFEADAPTGRVVYSFRLLDLGTLEPVTDVRVRACALTSLNCEEPVTLDLMVDLDGWVDIPLPTGFVGYLEIVGPTTIPSIFLIPPEFPAPGVPEFPGVLPTTADYALLASATLGRPLSPNEGAIAIRVFDCAWNPAVGVSVSADVPAASYYFQSGLPNPRATATDEAGIAGIMGLAPGVVTVRAQQADGLDIAAPRNFIVRAGWLSGAFMRPRRQTDRSPAD